MLRISAIRLDIFQCHNDFKSTFKHFFSIAHCIAFWMCQPTIHFYQFLNVNAHKADVRESEKRNGNCFQNVKCINGGKDPDYGSPFGLFLLLIFGYFTLKAKIQLSMPKLKKILSLNVNSCRNIFAEVAI